MTKDRLSIIACSIVGAFAIHCSSNPGDRVGDGGIVGDADAAECCTPTVASFTKLAEGQLEGSNTPAASSPPIDVAGYHEVIVYLQPGNCPAGTWLAASFTPVANGTFASTGQTVAGNNVASGGRLRVDGPQLVLKNLCGNVSVPYQVAGVR